MKRLSLTVITRNEAANLERCLQSVPFADEIVIVDSQSTDGTREIAHRYTDKVFDVPWEGFGKAKQAALANATGDWILSLDADEVVDAELASEIEHAIGQNGTVVGYRLNRISNFLGRWMRHSGWYPDLVLRLGRRTSMAVTPEVVHERISVEGRIADLSGHLLHYTDPDWPHYVQKLQRYADLSAQMLHSKGRRASAWDLCLRPPYQFARMYFLHAGFLDGVPGLLLAGGSAFHVFAKYARLWELNHGGAACSS
jgi:glycosyltransferase involved in cell wall biosynthesis